MKNMLIEYMGRGFLDNIIALCRQDRSVCRFIPDMLGSENLQVRIGTVALVEEMIKEHRDELRSAVPGLIGLLKHQNPTIRGDAASVLGPIKDRSSCPALETCFGDDHPAVREVARCVQGNMRALIRSRHETKRRALPGRAFFCKNDSRSTSRY